MDAAAAAAAARKASCDRKACTESSQLHGKTTTLARVQPKLAAVQMLDAQAAQYTVLHNTWGGAELQGVAAGWHA
jgi:hypothetical protein